MIIAPMNIGTLGAGDDTHGRDRADHATADASYTIRPPV